MTISFAQTADLSCPACGRAVSADIWLIVDAGERPDLMDHIHSGSLHNLTCPHCGTAMGQVDAPLLLFRADGQPVILFSPAQQTSQEQDAQQAAGLVGLLRERLGSRWQDEWLAQGLAAVQRVMLSAALSDDPEAAVREMADQVAVALERLRREDPEAFAQLEDAARAAGSEDAEAALNARPDLQTALLQALARQGGDEAAAQGAGLLQTIQQFIQAETWDASQRIVEQHPELLSDETETALGRLIEAAQTEGDEKAMRIFAEHRDLLHRCRDAGVARASAKKMSGAAGVQDLAALPEDDPATQAQAMLDRALHGQQIALAKGQLTSALLAAVENLASSEQGERANAARRLAYALRQAEARGATAGSPSVPPEFADDLRQAQEGEQRYLRTGDRVSLDAAAAAQERILQHQAFPASDERFQLAAMNHAGVVFLRCYWAMGRLEDLNRALELWQRSVGRTPPDSPDLSGYLNNLGNGLSARYACTGALADLEEATRVYQQAVGHTPPHSLALPSRLNNLGNGLRARYARTGRLEDLEEAIRVCQQAVGRASSDSPDLPGYLSNLGLGLSDRYARTGRLEDLEEAIRVYQQAVGRTPPDSPDLPLILNNLGGGLSDRYARTGRLEDLEEAIGVYQQAVGRTPPHSLALPSRLNNLGNGLRDRYARTGRLEDMEEAIRVYRQAVGYTPSDSPDLPPRLSNLGAGLRDRYARTGDLRDLEEAIGVSQQAVGRTPPDAPELPRNLNNLGAGLRDRYARTGVLADLEEAIRAFQQAVGRTSPDSSDLPMYLTNLGNGLIARYTRTGALADLEEAVGVYQQAVGRTPPDAPELPRNLNNLGTGLRDRYARTGRLADLEEAIWVFQQAVGRTPPDSPDLPALLTNLGAGLSARYARTGRLEDLEEAIRVYEQAVGRTPPDSPELPRNLSNLGTGLSARYARTGRLENLEEAIRVYEQAVGRTPPDSPDLPIYINNLGTGLRDRYARTGALEDLEEAIEVWRQAVGRTPPDSPELSRNLNNLGTGLRDRYARTGRLEDLEEARVSYRSACERGLELALEQALKSARNWGNWALARRAWQEAAQAYGFGRRAIDLLFATQIGRAAKESWLAEAQGLPANAAYALTRSGNLPGAVEALEGGRTRLLGEALESGRRDLERLRDLGHGELLKRYRQAVDRIQFLAEQTGQRTRQRGHEPAPSNLAKETEAARAELDAAIAAIREVEADGQRPYADFLLPPTFARIQQAAEVGTPLVYLLATPAGGLALIVADHQVEALWLDGVQETHLHEMLLGPEGAPAPGGYLGAYDRWRSESDKQAARSAWFDALDAAGRWLWDALMGPVVEHLGTMGVQQTKVIPAGVLGLLSLHAAWREDNDAPTGRRYALDSLTIGYAPSAVALAASREIAGRVAADAVLAVDNPDGSLVFSQQEVEAVLSYFPAGGQKPLRGKAATRQATQRELSHHPVLHFSTHGWAGWSEPLQGGLLMAGGSALTLADLLDLRLEHARLAVLSACETGIPGTKLPDEVVSLPTGLVQAGVAGVVASLWSVNDLSTAMLMERFYRLWRQEGLAPAEALRQAQVWLRDTTNREKVEYFRRDVPALAGFRMPAGVAADLYVDRMLSKNPDARDFAHPFYWAAFSLTGA